MNGFYLGNKAAFLYFPFLKTMNLYYFLKLEENKWYIIKEKPKQLFLRDVDFLGKRFPRRWAPAVGLTSGAWGWRPAFGLFYWWSEWPFAPPLLKGALGKTKA